MERFGAYEFPVIESVCDETPDFSVDALKNAESDDDEERHAQVFGR